MDGPVSVSSLLCQPNNRKRTHDHISNHSRESPCSFHDGEGSNYFNLDNAGSSINNAPSFSFGGLRMPPTRYRGDGFDMRTPVMSTLQAADVIDLTQEGSTTPAVTGQRQRNTAQSDYRVHESHMRTPVRAQRYPRFERTIIEPNRESNMVDLRESSPEVQFIRARTRSIPRGDQNQPNNPTQSNSTRGRPASLRPRRPDPFDSPRPQGIQLPGFAQAMRHIRPFMFGTASANQSGFGGREELVAIDGWEQEFEPINMGVNMQGFNLDQPSRPVQQPRIPTYEAPPPPREGFTRDLKEEDMLVCPNCDDELGVGDDDLKRQVWIIKGCGHVYCGECAKHRTVSRIPASSRERKTKPFKKCVVDGCQKNASSKNMIQVYL